MTLLQRLCLWKRRKCPCCWLSLPFYVIAPKALQTLAFLEKAKWGDAATQCSHVKYRRRMSMLQNIAIFWEITTFTFLMLFLTAKYSFIMTRKITIREARCLRHQLKGVCVFSDTAQKGRRSTPLYNNDTIVTLIGKPLPAKKEDFLQFLKRSPCFGKSGWKRRRLG